MSKSTNKKAAAAPKKRIKRIWIRTVFVLLGGFASMFLLSFLFFFLLPVSIACLVLGLVLMKVMCHCPSCGFGGLSLASTFGWTCASHQVVCPKCGKPIEIED